MLESVTSWFSAIALLWALWGFGSDLRKRRLPNVLNSVGVLIAAGCLAVTGKGCGQAPVEQCLLGGLAGLFALLPFWLFRLMGAGDVKFFAVMGLLGGVWILPPVFLIGSLLAAAMALLFLGARAGWLDFYAPPLLAGWLRVQAQRGLPFGAALALGFCLSLGLGLGQPQHLVAWLTG